MIKAALSELDKRVLTGVLGAAGLILLIVFGGWLGIFFITTVISLGMIYEFAHITYGLGDQIEKRYVLLCVTWFVEIASLLGARAQFELLVACFIAIFFYFLFTASRYDHFDLTAHFQELMYSVFGVVYLVFLPLYLPAIHETPNGVHWTILFLFIVWSGDTAAYFVGKKYGKHRLYSLISPKKSKEGAIGGLLAGYVITILYKLLFFSTMNWVAVGVIPLLVGVVAQVGDLCESFLKRAFDKKDSGSILPGHGGFLDRFDGVVMSLPVMYACIRILG